MIFKKSSLLGVVTVLASSPAVAQLSGTLTIDEPASEIVTTLNVPGVTSTSTTNTVAGTVGVAVDLTGGAVSGVQVTELQAAATADVVLQDSGFIIFIPFTVDVVISGLTVSQDVAGLGGLIDPPDNAFVFNQLGNTVSVGGTATFAVSAAGIVDESGMEDLGDFVVPPVDYGNAMYAYDPATQGFELTVFLSEVLESPATAPLAFTVEISGPIRAAGVLGTVPMCAADLDGDDDADLDDILVYFAAFGGMDTADADLDADGDEDLDDILVYFSQFADPACSGF